MQIISPTTKPATKPATGDESWADRPFILTPPTRSQFELPSLEESHSSAVPSFALLETGGPHPVSLLLSACFLCTLLAASILLVRLQPVPRAPQEITLTELQSSSEFLPADVLPKLVPASPSPSEEPDSPASPARPEPLRPSLFAPEPRPATAPPPPPVFADTPAEPLPRELMEFPPPIIPKPLKEPAAAFHLPAAMAVVAAPARTASAPVVLEPVAKPAVESAPKTPSILKPLISLPKSNPGLPTLPSRGSVAARAVSSVPSGPKTSKPAREAGANPGSGNPGPAPALGSLSLNELIQNAPALAANLAALPSYEREGLPQVSIRVNAEWFAALPQTQEKLYFSFTTPRADGQVLAYSTATQTLNLERAQRPLWQIRDAREVPELVALRADAARRLGVPVESVSLYTWHLPVLENALRMFVMERMEALGVLLGPRDVVTVRIASGASGAVMNLEPIRNGNGGEE